VAFSAQIAPLARFALRDASKFHVNPLVVSDFAAAHASKLENRHRSRYMALKASQKSS